MAKTFYTERDIEDLVKQGVLSLVVDDNAVLTDLAYTRAGQLGMELISQNDKPPAAPERPYIAQPVKKGDCAEVCAGTQRDLEFASV